MHLASRLDRCATLPPLRARVAASRALVPLVPPPRLAATIATIAAELPPPPPPGGRSTQKHNTTHGLLLQLRALVTGALDRGGGGGGGGGSSSSGGGGGDDLQLDGAVEEACSAALAAVRPALWLLSAARCPCAPVRSALLQLLTPTLRGLGALAGARPLGKRIELPGWGGRLPERGGEGVWRG